MVSSSIHWFRKGLRLHDNPALVEAVSSTDRVFPLFVMDPWFAKPDKIGGNRYEFLLQSLRDLDESLREIGTRLYVVKGKPDEQIPRLCKKWDVSLVTFEKDSEPYAVARDAAISNFCTGQGIKTATFCSHTLYEPSIYIDFNKGDVPKSYQSFNTIFAKLSSSSSSTSALRKPISAPTAIKTPFVDNSEIFDVPTLTEMGYPPLPQPLKFPGGEKEALRRLKQTILDRPEWAANFDKPKTSPNALEPTTSVLSPYLKFGCLSSSHMYHILADIYSKRKHSSPPVSFHGQLLWREFFYMHSVGTPNFDKMLGNPAVKQIPWGTDEEKLLAWKEGRTGFPFIDAIMTQLRVEGWIHHLARHAVACFLTRGDLWQHWEEGAAVFDLYLLDADWALNNANWQWLSCSNFFYQFFRCYSPVAFGKKTDPSGAYIRKWVPILAKYPDKFIYEPWMAPKESQKAWGCVIGKDYPSPICDHATVSKQNMGRLKDAYDAMKAKGGGGSIKSSVSDDSDGVGGKRKGNSSTSTGASASKESKKDISTYFEKKSKKS